MNEIVGLSGYLAIGVAVLLLGGAVLLARRFSEPTGPAAAPAPVPTSAPGPASIPPARLRRRRPADHLSQALIGCVVLAGLAIVLAAVLWDAPDDLPSFWLLLGVGAAFAAVAASGLGTGALDDDAPTEDVARTGELAPSAAGSRSAIWSRESWRELVHLPRPALLLLGVALVLEWGALALFGIGRGLSYAWLAHLGAVSAAGVGIWRLAAPAERRMVPGWSRIDAVAIGVMVVAALAVRLWRLGTVPEGLWYDESQRGLEVLRMLAERGYRPIFAAAILQEPTGLWYLMMPLVAALGRDAVALRLPVALAGAAGVGAIYLLARVLYGWRVAIIAAGLAVAMTWHLNFSRVALPAVVSLTCDTFALALFVAGLRRESRVLLGLAGLVCGAGLYFYFTSQLMPFVLVLAGVHQVLARRFRLPPRLLAGLAACALAFVLAAAPFGFYALTQREEFLRRADAVNVFRDVENARSIEPILANVRAHLLMFQVHGDNNGRHNWTGRPMLDPVTGGLMILGLGLALLRAWRLESALVLGWIPIALAGGILSSIWDAPQSHRAIDALVPALLLAALPLGLLWRAADAVAGAPAPNPSLTSGSEGIFGILAFWQGGVRPTHSASAPALHRSGAGVREWILLPRHIAPALVAALLLGTGAMNLDRYFSIQQADEKTWTEFMAPQTLAGRQIAALPQSTLVYLEPNWVGHPSVRFVDPGQHAIAPFDPGSSLPVTDETAAIFIAGRPGVAQRIQAMYPGAQRTTTYLPRTDRPFGFGFILPPEVVRAPRGVTGRYQAAGAPGGAIERREPSLNLDLPASAPLAPPFAASWTATLSVPDFAPYRVRLEGPATLALTLDGLEAVRGGGESTFRLARGNHALRLEGSDLGRESIRLLWARPNEDFQPVPENRLNSRPVQAEGLLGRVYRGDQPAGDPVTEQIDPNVELRVHLLPAPRPYTLEWSGAIRIEHEGRHGFSLSSLGASGLWIDGKEVVRKDVAAGIAAGTIELSEGWHDIRIRFLDSTDFTYITASWQPPGAAEPAVIPPGVLRPWPADRVLAARPEDGDLP